MARRYTRDRRGRFASGSGAGSNKPVIRSIKASDTRVAGKMAQIEAGRQKGKRTPLMPRPRLKSGNSGASTTQKVRAIQNMYRKDPRGLISDIRVTRRRRQSLDSLAEM